jgi:CDP-paratose 2-epimerase
MKYLITGGAGFIGSHLAERLLEHGNSVVILDNFYRNGSRTTALWLKSLFTNRLEIIEADVSRDMNVINDCVSKCDAVFHFAAQVAVTGSVIDPRLDFETNILGTFNVLEAIRAKSSATPLFFSSTNKVYGSLSAETMEETDYRYVWPMRRNGISESQSLDLYSPYGCSKGSADQYVLDYARIYGLATVVFRQSCIYGPRQFGIEDQGWLAWFAIAGSRGIPITLYGSGKQVRDVLFVSDLLDLFELALAKIDRIRGNVYNVGGGSQNTLSLLESIPIIEKALSKRIRVEHGEIRPGDQYIYVSDISRVKMDLGWLPTVGISEGIRIMTEWISRNFAT